VGKSEAVAAAALEEEVGDVLSSIVVKN